MMDKKENRAVIDALRPHFIFNTMNILRLMIKKDSDRANQMVYDLSLYLRGHMEGIISEELIDIKEELNFAEAYLRLEQVSHPNLKYHFMEIQGVSQVPIGCVQTLVEQLFKEYIRVTKETRTLILESKSVSEEVELWISIPEEAISRRVNTNEREKSDIFFSQ